MRASSFPAMTSATPSYVTRTCQSDSAAATSPSVASHRVTEIGISASRSEIVSLSFSRIDLTARAGTMTSSSVSAKRSSVPSLNGSLQPSVSKVNAANWAVRLKVGGHQLVGGRGEGSVDGVT